MNLKYKGRTTTEDEKSEVTTAKFEYVDPEGIKINLTVKGDAMDVTHFLDNVNVRAIGESVDVELSGTQTRLDDVQSPPTD